MTKPDRRRWLRFSLRTMFVAVTVTAIVVGWLTRELAFVRQRAAFARSEDIVSVAWMRKLPPNTQAAFHFSIPCWRRWLGDDAAAFVNLRDGCDGNEAHLLFPEANITIVGADGHLKELIPPQRYALNGDPYQ
jgi:hypothetical protein